MGYLNDEIKEKIGETSKTLGVHYENLIELRIKEEVLRFKIEKLKMELDDVMADITSLNDQIEVDKTFYKKIINDAVIGIIDWGD